MIRLAIIGLLSVVLSSCNNHSSRLASSLRKSGDNKGELQTVIRHYSAHPEDSLKLRAAIFLIANMAGHYSLCGERIDQYMDNIDSLLSCKSFAEGYLLRLTPYHYPNIRNRLNKQDDLTAITSTFLIDHIDRFIKLYERQPYPGSFADFCEYVLPYTCPYAMSMGSCKILTIRSISTAT